MAYQYNNNLRKTVGITMVGLQATWDCRTLVNPRGENIKVAPNA